VMAEMHRAVIFIPGAGFDTQYDIGDAACVTVPGGGISLRTTIVELGRVSALPPVHRTGPVGCSRLPAVPWCDTTSPDPVHAPRRRQWSRAGWPR
jgi:hypothetical protein